MWRLPHVNLKYVQEKLWWRCSCDFSSGAIYMFHEEYTILEDMLEGTKRLYREVDCYYERIEIFKGTPRFHFSLEESRPSYFGPLLGLLL